MWRASDLRLRRVRATKVPSSGSFPKSSSRGGGGATRTAPRRPSSRARRRSPSARRRDQGLLGARHRMLAPTRTRRRQAVRAIARARASLLKAAARGAPPPPLKAPGAIASRNGAPRHRRDASRCVNGAHRRRAPSPIDAGRIARTRRREEQHSPRRPPSPPADAQADSTSDAFEGDYILPVRIREGPPPRLRARRRLPAPFAAADWRAAPRPSRRPSGSRDENRRRAGPRSGEVRRSTTRGARRPATAAAARPRSRTPTRPPSRSPRVLFKGTPSRRSGERAVFRDDLFGDAFVVERRVSMRAASRPRRRAAHGRVSFLVLISLSPLPSLSAMVTDTLCVILGVERSSAIADPRWRRRLRVRRVRAPRRRGAARAPSRRACVVHPADESSRASWLAFFAAAKIVRRRLERARRRARLPRRSSRRAAEAAAGAAQPRAWPPRGPRTGRRPRAFVRRVPRAPRRSRRRRRHRRCAARPGARAGAPDERGDTRGPPALVFAPKTDERSSASAARVRSPRGVVRRAR